MEILFLLIPLSIVLLVIAITAFFWAVKHQQFNDMDTPARQILEPDHPQELTEETSEPECKA